MLSQKLRPHTFDSMIGQDNNKKILKAIIKNPANAPKSLIFEGEYGTGKCVTGDTRILTDKGYFPIKDYFNALSLNKESEFLPSCNLLSFNMDNIVKRYYQKDVDCVKVVLDTGHYIEGTLEHPIISLNKGDRGLSAEWKKLKNVHKGDYVAVSTYDYSHFIMSGDATPDIPSTIVNKYPFKQSEYLKGYLTGLINLSVNRDKVTKEKSDVYKITILMCTDRNKELDDFYTRIVDIFKSIFSENFVKSCVTIRKIHRALNSIIRIDIESSKMMKFFESVGFRLVNTRLPEYTFDSNEYFLYGVYMAFNDVFGHVYRKKLGFSYSMHFPIDSTLLKDFDSINQLLGIVYSKTEEKSNRYIKLAGIDNPKVKKKYSYIFKYGLSSYINLQNTCKRFKFKSVKELNFTPSYRYRSHEFYKLLYDKLLKSRTVTDFINESDNLNTDKEIKEFIKSICDYKGLDSTTFDSLLDNATVYDLINYMNLSSKNDIIKKILLFTRLRFVKVKDVYSTGKHLVYDLTVDKTHMFMSNGIISHNTTSSRIFAQELNKGYIKDNHIDIDSPNYNILNMPFYYEFDSTVIGNVENIKILRDNFAFESNDYTRVIVMDEAQSISKEAMNALLKILEEVGENTFFIFDTTEINKLLPTIRSRSLELHFGKINREDIIKGLRVASDNLNVDIDDNTLALIADCSMGHMRNAHMLLDKYILLGKENFVSTTDSAIGLYCKYFNDIWKYYVTMDNIKKDVYRQYIVNDIQRILNIPKYILEYDWNIFVRESSMIYSGVLNKDTTAYKNIADLVLNVYQSHFAVIFKCFLSPWVHSMFDSKGMAYIQSVLLNFYIIIGKYLSKKIGS